MFSIRIAARQRGTIDLQSGIFDRHNAVHIITSMTDLSEKEATEIISNTIRIGLLRQRRENFEILAKVLSSDNCIDNLAGDYNAGDPNEMWRSEIQRIV